MTVVCMMCAFRARHDGKPMGGNLPMPDVVVYRGHSLCEWHFDIYLEVLERCRRIEDGTMPTSTVLECEEDIVKFMQEVTEHKEPPAENPEETDDPEKRAVE